MGRPQKRVGRHLRKRPKPHSNKRKFVRGHLRIKRTDIKLRGKGR